MRIEKSCLLLLWLATGIHAQQHVPGNVNSWNPQNQWTRQAKTEVMEHMQKQLTEFQNRWYVRFSIEKKTPTPRRQFFGGIVPFNSSNLVEHGYIEFSQIELPPTTSASRRSRGIQWWIGAHVRIRSYRIFDPRTGWSDRQFSATTWEWSGEVKDDKLTLECTTDLQDRTSDGGVGSFVAAVFNVERNQVTCLKPEVKQIAALNPVRSTRQVVPTVRRKSTRDPYYQPPRDGKPVPWRARYGQVAPIFSKDQ